MAARILPVVGLLLLLPAAARAETPRLSDERIVMQTDAGDVVFALYPDVAPRHVEQFLKLVRLGVYDHTFFFRVEPNSVLQLGLAQQRHVAYPLTATQLGAIHTLPAEFTNTLKHERGILSMAREDNKPDSATTSFSIVLGDQPHLDGQYTIFGTVVYGMDVVDKLVQVPPFFIDPHSQPVPIIPLDVEKMEIVAAKDLDVGKLTPAHDVMIPPSVFEKAHIDAWEYHRKLKDSPNVGPEPTDFDKTYLLTGCVLIVIMLSMVSFLGAGRLRLRWLISLNMLNILIGAFLLLVLLTPYAQVQWPLAIVVFIAFFGLFKLLSRFESVG